MDISHVLSKSLRTVMRTEGLRYSVSTFPNAPKNEGFDFVPRPLSDHYTLGFAKESILPEDIGKRKYYIAGYHENNPAQGVLDAPHAHALWIDDNSSHGGIVLVSLDCVGILNKDVNEIRRRLKNFCMRNHCRSVNVMCTHNHAGIDTMGIWGPLPFTGRDKKYMEFLFGKVVKAVEDAYASRKDGDLYYGTVEVPDMQEDIRLPKVYSRTLTRLRFVPRDGSRETYIVNFASHSESLQGCNSRVSADFPAYFRERILEESGADCFYCVGCIGGMISMAIPNEKEIRDNGSDFAPNTKEIGRKLAGYALGISEEKKLPATISCMRREFYFEADNTVLMIAAVAKIMLVDKYHLPSAPLCHGLKSEISYFEIGGIKILGIPCELFPELAYGGYLSAEESGTGKGAEINPTPLTEIFGGNLNFIGLFNDEVGYVIPPNDFMLDENAPYFNIPKDSLGRRHYEETNSLGPATAVKIAEVAAEIAAAVEKSKKLW